MKDKETYHCDKCGATEFEIKKTENKKDIQIFCKCLSCGNEQLLFIW